MTSRALDILTRNEEESNDHGKDETFHQSAPVSLVMALLHANSRRARFVCFLSAVALLSSVRFGWFSSTRGDESGRPSDDAGLRRRRRRDSMPQVFYSYMRPDRAGAVIQDMLLAHAFAFAKNMTYGGACRATGSENDMHSSTSNLTADQVSVLLFHLGLDDVLPIACPPLSPSENTHTRGTIDTTTSRAGPLVDRKYYGRFHLRFCSAEWQTYMRTKVQRRLDDDTNRSPHNPSNHQQQHHSPVENREAACVLHIRRGDVTPCDPGTRERYLPNSYYRKLVDRYAPAHCRVMIYSERTSIEPWDDFRNYSLRLGTGDSDGHSPQVGGVISASLPSSSMRDLAKIWIDMVTADVLILSKSSFSLVPALLSGAPSPLPPSRSVLASPRFTPPRIVYTDFWVDPLPHWTRVSQSLQRQAVLDAERIQNEYCSPPRDAAL